MIFSKDPQIAEQQMIAVLVYLTTIGYIDGKFEVSEKVFVLDYIKELVDLRIRDQGVTDPVQQMDMGVAWAAHYNKIFEQIDDQIRRYFDEVVAGNENLDKFVYARLKLSCFELFKAFEGENQRDLLDAGTKLIGADGKVHPNEEKFRQELVALLRAPETVALEEQDLEPVPTVPLKVNAPVYLRPAAESHPLLELMERHYSRDPARLKEQIGNDLDLVTQAMALWSEQRRAGAGKLMGKHNVGQLAGLPPFLDGHVYVHMPARSENVELLVFGDLHGCYSCLKGALLQADFFGKIMAYRRDPARNPNIKLVFIGDYIDRGFFSFNGIMRTVLQLFVSMPEHVYVLRGNHEYFTLLGGRVAAGVRPAEGIATLEPHVPHEALDLYRRLFEEMPNIVLFDRTIFVHAGIARDEILHQRWRDLSTLNDPDIRFQMMWSDPSRANYIPAELQRENARFPFGKQQFRTFMNQIGCTTMVRGHEKIDEGFRKIYDDADVSLLNLFSAGGRNNNDLPPTSSYRAVTPMALTIRWKDGQGVATPFAIDWESYQYPQRNAFFRSPPELEFRQ